MSVHYKFKSSKDKHTVIFDGLHISVGDLKKEIMKQRKIGRSADLDLQITNPQTGEVYESDSTLIPKNTSVEVARVPVSGNQKKSWDRHENNSSKGANSPSHIELDKITKSSNLSTSYGTEDEKIKAMMSQSTQEYDPSKYVKNRGIVGPLPSNYTCYRCGQPGHYIKQCPTNNTDVKRSTGIPRSFMIPAKADQKGALLTASGDYAVPIIDHEAYKVVKKEKAPFLPNSELEKEEPALPEIPEDLKCTLCQDLLQDAVLIPCCGNSYCDECVRTLLLESENHECPTCHEVNVSPDTLIPNRYLRISVAKFKNDTGYERDKYISDHIKNNQIKQSQTETNVQNLQTKNLVETNSENAEIKTRSSPQRPQSPFQTNSDVTMDEVILGSPKKEEVAKPVVEAQPVAQPSTESNKTPSQQLDETNDSNEGNANDSQQETATGSNTPLVDEPPESYETNEEQTNQTETNPIVTLPHYQNQPLLTIPAYARPPRMIGPIRAIRTTVGQQPSHALLGRPPAILPHPRNVYPRPGLTQDARYYRPITDPRGFPIGMAHVPPYGYTPQMRPPAYHDPYGYMGPRSHIPTGPMHHTLGHPQAMAEAPPPGTAPLLTDNIYPYSKPDYDDYEDRVNRFTRQLESRPTRRPKARSITRSRSRSHSRSSRSRSSSESSSSSSSSSSRSSRFSFSSRSYSGSSRSRSYSPRRRSRSRDRYRRRSRSPSPRYNYNRDFRYRRSRSPHYSDSSRRYGRSRRGYENDREKDSKYRDNRIKRYEQNDSSYRSRRSDDRNKDSKPTNSSRCNHKSSNEKSRTRDEVRHKSRSKTPLKDENERVPETRESITKSELSEVKKETQEVESDANKMTPANNESHKEIDNKSVVSPENDRTDETDDKNEKKKDKDKDKSKKHHKHHHHHRHRKGSEDSKNGKATDESKSTSKKKHKHKKHSKQYESVDKAKTSDDMKEEMKDTSEENSNQDLTSVDSRQEADVSHLQVLNQYETDLGSVNQRIKTEVNNDAVLNNLNELNPENIINSYELYDGIDSISDNKNSNLDEFSADLPNYSTVEFSTDSNKTTNEEVAKKESEAVVDKVQLVDYTDNEDLAEAAGDLRTDLNYNQLNRSDSENNDKTDPKVEVPKCKWDEDFNDLRFEEDYSDFEESQKSEDQDSRGAQNDKSLPNDILQKAEKAILEKPLRAAIIEKRDKTSNSDKKAKTSKNDERERRDKDSDRERKDRERDRVTNSDNSNKNWSKSQLSESKEVKNNDESSNDLSDNHPRKVKLDRSKFAEKMTLSITIDNSEKEKTSSRSSRSSNRNNDKDSKSYSSYKSSRERSKDRSRSERKPSKDRKESSKSSKSRDDSRHRSHKRGKRSRSRSSSSHKRYKTERESHKKSKSKSTSNKKSK